MLNDSKPYRPVGTLIVVSFLLFVKVVEVFKGVLGVIREGNKWGQGSISDYLKDSDI